MSGAFMTLCNSSGREMMSVCGAGNRLRYRTLLHIEASVTAGQLDFGCVILPACQIVESELDRLLTGVLRPLAGTLSAQMATRKCDRHAAATLADWGGGKLLTSIGLLSVLLVAVRRCVTRQDAGVIACLESRFGPDYADLLVGQRLDAALEQVRLRFRNPACHGQRVFGLAEYRAFCDLVIGRASFAAWDAQGIAPDGEPVGAAVLHHHLASARPCPTVPLRLATDAPPADDACEAA